MRRVSEYSNSLAIHIRRLKKEFHSIYTCDNNIIAPEPNHATSASHYFTKSSWDTISTGFERPLLNIMEDKTQLFNIYRPWKEVASYLGISATMLM